MSDARQKIREFYKPNKVNILFIGESSPPNEKIFFYYANSNLFRCIQKAFSEVFNEKCGDEKEFLFFFKNHDCFLDDICHESFYKKSPEEKETLLNENIESLSVRIKEMKPKAIIIVVKRIARYVMCSLEKTGLKSVPVFITTFPRDKNNEDKNKKKCVEDIGTVLEQLIQINILTY